MPPTGRRKRLPSHAATGPREVLSVDLSSTWWPGPCLTAPEVLRPVGAVGRARVRGDTDAHVLGRAVEDVALVARAVHPLLERGSGGGVTGRDVLRASRRVALRLDPGHERPAVGA